MKTVFIFIAFSILISINSYVWVRGWHALPTGSITRPIYLTTMIGCFLALLGGMIFGNLMPLPLARAISFIGFTYIIVFVYLMVSFWWWMLFGWLIILSTSFRPEWLHFVFGH